MFSFLSFLVDEKWKLIANISSRILRQTAQIRMYVKPSLDATDQNLIIFKQHEHGLVHLHYFIYFNFVYITISNNWFLK